MKSITDHHAYIIFSDPETAREIITNSNQGQVIREYSFELLGVDEVAEIQTEFKEWQSQKTWVVIYAERMSPVAQNKFLKTLEEPVPEITFIIVLPKSVQVIGTVLSRVVVIRPELNYKNLLFPVKDFLTKSVTDRIEMIDTLHKSRKDESYQSYEVQHFLDALESGLAIMFHKKPNLNLADSFSAIRQARIWSKQTGVPQKNILDYVAVMVSVL